MSALPMGCWRAERPHIGVIRSLAHDIAVERSAEN